MVLLPTRFTHPAAVETWDASFRWREGDTLRDLTIDDTWWRVAQALAPPAADGQAVAWAQRYAHAFGRWQLLPGEALLRLAGTGAPLPATEPLRAVVNVAEFATAAYAATPGLDLPGIADTAALAVRLLDDALLRTGRDPRAVMQVGLMGFADAMTRLGVRYDSEQARRHARDIARALAEGCLRGSIELAAERGARIPPADCRRRAPLWQARGMPQGLIDRAGAIGLRHACLIGLDAHPLLARLANGVSEGLKPRAEDPDGAKPGDAEQALLAAVQQWIDAGADHVDAGATDAAPTTASGSLSSHPV